MFRTIYIQFTLILLVFLNYSCTLRLHAESYIGIKNQVANSFSSRIVGGEIAAQSSAPWQVSLQNQNGQHFCGGAILADQFIVTAASCVAGMQNRMIKVVTGTNDWTNSAKKFDVIDIIIHCNFDKPLYHNDIALLKLGSIISYDEYTQNITIPFEDDLIEAEKLLMTGWGSYEIGSGYPLELKSLQVSYVSQDKCRTVYAQYANDVDDGHLCVLPNKNSGPCHGDTGGPLVNNKGQLVGIGNWGVPCAKGFPDVFARLSFYNDWIRTSMKGCN